MMEAARYLNYVDDDLANAWSIFWQEADRIVRIVSNDASGTSKKELLRDEMLKKDAETEKHLRDRYSDLDALVKQKLAARYSIVPR
jgi:hypothetical protein